MRGAELCAVLGGDGFIGSHIVHGLLAHGFRVRVVDRFPHGKSINLRQIEDRIEIVAADLFDPDHFDNSILDGVKYLFHFAVPSTPSSSLLDPVEEFRRHLSPTVRLFQTMKEIGVHRILFPSSGGTVYGLRPRCPAAEDDCLVPFTPHSIVKVALERYLSFLRLQGLDSIVYRIANAYGPGQRGWMTRQGVISVFLRAALLEEPVPVIGGGGETIRDYIFVDDLVDVMLRSFDKPHRYHVYNVGFGRGTSLRTIIHDVERITGTRLRRTLQQGRVGETTRIVLDVRRVSREFGWRPETSLLSGVRKTWEWIQTIAHQELAVE
jgi:UDP-glucose 4-epimerase